MIASLANPPCKVCSTQTPVSSNNVCHQLVNLLLGHKHEFNVYKLEPWRFSNVCTLCDVAKAKAYLRMHMLVHRHLYCLRAAAVCLDTNKPPSPLPPPPPPNVAQGQCTPAETYMLCALCGRLLCVM